ncbi:metalloproteinase inhibitor 3-like [Lineus longissimus]|uniref:metalloproteinase inhibitor 3-like n=1 Tax=Lineus longissimus TaxID=88925 RepID=UPI002B4E0783
MILSIRTLLSSLLILYGLVVYAESCSCQQSHPQDQYCKADFVIKARVKGNEKLYTKYLGKNYETGEKISYRRPYQQRYTVKIMKIYKGEDVLKNVSKQHLITALNGAMCGVSLQQGTKYVIMGSIEKGKMHTDLCQFNQRWSSLNGRERKSLNSYGKQCKQCEIQVCYRTDCKADNTSNICSWDQQHYARDCYLSSVCTKHDKDTCRWSKNSYFRACYKKKKRAYLSEP